MTSCLQMWAFSLLFVALSGFSAAHGASSTSSDGSRTDWESIVGAAKKEGKVVIYGAPGVEVDTLFKQYFEVAYPGIKI